MENRYIEDEISLKELILNLIEYKKLIALITVVAIVLGGLYAFVLSDEIYEVSTEGTMMISETASSKYGTFTFPSTFKGDFLGVITSEEVLSKVITTLGLEYSTETLSKKITVNSEEDSSNFEIVVQDTDRELASSILKTINEAYINAINMKYKKLAVDLFERDYYVTIRSLEESIVKQEANLDGYRAQLETIPQVITLKKLLTSDPSLAAQIARDRGVSIESLTDEMMLEEIQNPNYSSLEQTIIGAESSLNNSVISLKQNTELYEELKAEKTAIEAYYNDGKTDTLNGGSLEFMRSRISISPYFSAPETPVAPRKALILAISGVLGVMMGVFVAFFMAYWKNS